MTTTRDGPRRQLPNSSHTESPRARTVLSSLAARLRFEPDFTAHRRSGSSRSRVAMHLSRSPLIREAQLMAGHAMRMGLRGDEEWPGPNRQRVHGATGARSLFRINGHVRSRTFRWISYRETQAELDSRHGSTRPRPVVTAYERADRSDRIEARTAGSRYGRAGSS